MTGEVEQYTLQRGRCAQHIVKNTLFIQTLNHQAYKGHTLLQYVLKNSVWRVFFNCFYPPALTALQVGMTTLENGGQDFNLQPCPLLHRADVNPITKCTQDREREREGEENKRESECVIILRPWGKLKSQFIGRGEPSLLIVFNEALMGNMHGWSARALIRGP